MSEKVEEYTKRPVGRPGNKPVIKFLSFQYRAESWEHERRIVVKIEHHKGELFPRIGYIVTSLSWDDRRVVKFYNKRGTCEQWIKEGKYALNWTRLSCQGFMENEVRLKLFIMAYNLGNIFRTLALPEGIKDWSLRTIQLKLIKIGGRLIMTMPVDYGLDSKKLCCLFSEFILFEYKENKGQMMLFFVKKG